MKTLIGINNLTTVDQLAYANHIQFFYRLGKDCGNDSFALCNPRRMGIDRMRNECAKIAMEGEFDRLMFIDDDVLVPIDAYKRLVHADKDIVAGVTLIRGYPFHPMIFNFKENKYGSYFDDYLAHADPQGLVKCDAVGFSCCMIKVELLKKMIPPYFITTQNQTEDVYFCIRAKQQFSDIEIYADVRLETAHILGSDIIEPKTRDAWLKMEEERYPGLAEIVKEKEGSNNKRSDRSVEDLEKKMGIAV